MIRFLFILGFLLTLSPSLQGQEAPAALEPQGWTTWVTLGGYITSDPAACTIGNWTFVVARGTDNKMWYRRRSLASGIWDGWKQIPGTLTFVGSPAVSCVDNSNGPEIDVIAIGNDSRLWRAYLLNDDWSVWHVMSGTVQWGTGPAQAVIAYYMHNFFVRGTDSTVFHRYFFNGTWHDWSRVSGVVTADPAATMQSPSHMDLVVRAQDGTLLHRFWEGGIWHPYYPVGGGFVTSSPDVISRARGSLDLFVRGQANTLLHKRWVNGVWGGWTDLGGYLTSGPGATTYASNARMMVFVRGSNGALFYRAWAS